MTLRLYETASRKLQEVITTNDEISIYCCGPTVYRDAHVGNLRTFLLADLVRRTLEVTGSTVNMVQNITDVGHMSEDFQEQDKILAQSADEKIDPFDVARKYEANFHKDLSRLNIRQANKYPRASESIELMHESIQILIEKNFAYIGKDRNVYFDARSFATYGAISGNRLDALKPGHRYEYTEKGDKRFHADWALWKSAGDRKEMIWDSPWGPGFPGWHIECSAMSLFYLKKHIDIHIGGIDLRFPHHENERAQSNAIIGTEAVDLWLHGEHLLFEGRKMSKSSGNVVLLQDVIDKGFDPLSLRLCFLENRYRSQMDLTWDSIAAANSTLKRWRQKLMNWAVNEDFYDSEFVALLENDLDTPKAIQYLRSIEKDDSIQNHGSIFAFADKVLGLELTREEIVLPLTLQQLALLEERLLARKGKNWQESDRLRVELEATGLEIVDSAEGQSWSWR